MRRVIHHTPASIGEALALKAELGPDARLLAGGTDLLIALRQEPASAPPIEVIDLGQLADLAQIAVGDDAVVLGALATHAQIADHPALRVAVPLLADACAAVGSPQIRHRGTLGGNLVNASPCADTAPPLIALDAQLVLRSVRGERRVPLDAALLAPYRTALEADEILVAVTFPRPAAGTGTAFVKLGRRNALAVSRMSVAVRFRRDDGGRFADVRVAAGSVVPTPCRFPAVEELLDGQIVEPTVMAAAGRRLAEEMVRITGRRWSTPYKEPVAASLLERALQAAAESIEAAIGRGTPSSLPERPFPPAGVRPPAPGDPAVSSLRPGSGHDAGVAFVLNGRLVHVTAPPQATLLQVLRDELLLTGTKCGCEIGECGACTVILDGETACSCLLLIGQVAGRRVTTVEGLAAAVAPDGTGLHPLQRAFLDQDAVACGFCTPGMLMAARALLDRNPQPTRQEIQCALSGTLCRCTGYHPIIAAVEQAARDLERTRGTAT
ncbi:MAG: FAD binding domain-containing protein [Candidatus Krumholzibacteriia bacterium]